MCPPAVLRAVLRATHARVCWYKRVCVGVYACVCMSTRRASERVRTTFRDLDAESFDLVATAESFATESFATEAPVTLPGGLESCRDFNLR